MWTAGWPTQKRFRTTTTPSIWWSVTPCFTTSRTSSSLFEKFCAFKPGGRFVFAGEPTTVGNFYARWLGRITWEATTRATKLPFLADWRKPQEELDESSRAAALEAVVDLHTFDPTDLENIALSAGAEAVQANTEEFAAALLGWPVRTFEAAVPAGKLGWNWAKFAFNGWKTLSWVDEKVLQHVVPRGMFYNVMITGTKPAPRA